MRRFVAESDYAFPVMLDSGGLANRHGVRAIPTHVVIDSEGRVAWTHVGAITADALSSVVDDLTG